MARMAAPWAFSTAPGPATRGCAHVCQPVGAAAVLRAHGQDGYLDECIRGERTALRQAVQPNGTNKSLTVTLAVMRHSQGIIRGGPLVSPPDIPKFCGKLPDTCLFSGMLPRSLMVPRRPGADRPASGGVLQPPRCIMPE